MNEQGETSGERNYDRITVLALIGVGISQSFLRFLSLLSISKDVDEFRTEVLGQLELCNWRFATLSAPQSQWHELLPSLLFIIMFILLFTQVAARRTPSAVQFGAGIWLIPILGHVFRHMLRLDAAELQCVGKGALPLLAFAGFHHTVVLPRLRASSL